MKIMPLLIGHIFKDLFVEHEEYCVLTDMKKLQVQIFTLSLINLSGKKKHQNHLYFQGKCSFINFTYKYIFLAHMTGYTMETDIHFGSVYIGRVIV